jgi:hypothetical protein
MLFTSNFLISVWDRQNVVSRSNGRSRSTLSTCLVYIIVGSTLLTFCMVIEGRICNHKQLHKLQPLQFNIHFKYTKNRQVTLEVLTWSFVKGIYFLHVQNFCRLISVATNLCQIPREVGRYFIFAIGSREYPVSIQCSLGVLWTRKLFHTLPHVLNAWRLINHRDYLRLRHVSSAKST